MVPDEIDWVIPYYGAPSGRKEHHSAVKGNKR